MGAPCGSVEDKHAADRGGMEAAHFAARSAALSPSHGCAIASEDKVISCGRSGTPPSVSATSSRLDGPDRERWVEHAARNAIYAAAKSGLSTAGAAAYMTVFPCAECMRGLIQCGINRLCVPQPERESEQWQTALAMADEAGMRVVSVGRATQSFKHVK